MINTLCANHFTGPGALGRLAFSTYVHPAGTFGMTTDCSMLRKTNGAFNLTLGLNSFFTKASCVFFNGGAGGIGTCLKISVPLKGRGATRGWWDRLSIITNCLSVGRSGLQFYFCRGTGDFVFTNGCLWAMLVEVTVAFLLFLIFDDLLRTSPVPFSPVIEGCSISSCGTNVRG